MQKLFYSSIVLILFVGTLPVFSQQRPPNKKVCEGEIFDSVPKEHTYGFKLSEPTVIDTKDVEHPFPALGGKVDWGLALSGGGIRSSAFSIGVMKALYDKKILDNIDVISSVSGGGYASYWLFTNYHRHKPQKFGEAAFADNVFVRNMCEFQGKGNFFPNKRAARTFFRRGITPFRTYENAILRSFGNGEPFDTKMNHLNSYIKDGHAPYIIINTTLVSDEMGGLGKLFEITPTHMGNPIIGFYRWEQNGKESLRWSESITMSAAALGKLKRPIPNFAPHVIKAKNLQLWDGGKTENLGALPLIRRGVRNIVIVDAEHDFDYKFEAYTKLRKLLDGMGIEFRVPDIEEFLQHRKKKRVYSKSAVSMGYARLRTPDKEGATICSRIFYVKMSRPESILSDNRTECDKANDPENIENNEHPYKIGLEHMTNIEAKTKDICLNGDWFCEGAAGIPFKKEMYIYRVRKYSRYLNCENKWRHLPKVFSSELDFRYNFPQITTWDQDYYRDQLEAFVGLGYLQASEVDKRLQWEECAR